MKSFIKKIENNVIYQIKISKHGAVRSKQKFRDAIAGETVGSNKSGDVFSVDYKNARKSG